MRWRLLWFNLFYFVIISTMNRKTLIEAVHASHQNLSKANVAKIVDSVLFSMRTAIVKWEDLLLQNFITLKHVTRKARNGFNPYHGTKLQIPAKKSLKLKVGAGLKKDLNK